MSCAQDDCPRLELSRRTSAARSLPALPGRFGPDLAARNPLLPWSAIRRQPCTFSLTDDERRREAVRLHASGWTAWEVAAVLAAPKSVAP